MATTKAKAQSFIKEMDAALSVARDKFGIATADIDLIIRVNIEDRVIYNLHEDED